ncbi:hypothetical protein [Cellvibrio mixtus]|uniref:hypothetical protein n=1 Tax=Cellvibrio mixtus TaxID=39650 RepID=UPI001269A30F|nr:hypothetical protein [Cellvibrio mixtus]
MNRTHVTAANPQQNADSGKAQPQAAQPTNVLASYQCFPFTYTYYGFSTEACVYETPVAAPPNNPHT